MQLRAIIATRRECGLNMSVNLHQPTSKLVENDSKTAFRTVGQWYKSRKSNVRSNLPVPNLSRSSIISEYFGNIRK